MLFGYIWAPFNIPITTVGKLNAVNFVLQEKTKFVRNYILKNEIQFWQIWDYENLKQWKKSIAYNSADTQAW